MFGISATALLATAAVVGTAVSGYNANKARQDQRSANRQAAADAKRQASLADQANNRANAKAPDLGAMFAGNGMPGGVSPANSIAPPGSARHACMMPSPLGTPASVSAERAACWWSCSMSIDVRVASGAPRSIHSPLTPQPVPSSMMDS